MRVRKGSGRAWGWVNISIDEPRPLNCSCKPADEYCAACKQRIGEIDEIASTAVRGIKFYTYDSDMGQGINEYTIAVHFVDRPSLLQAIQTKDTKAIAQLEKTAEAGQTIRIM